MITSTKHNSTKLIAGWVIKLFSTIKMYIWPGVLAWARDTPTDTYQVLLEEVKISSSDSDSDSDTTM